MTIVLAISNVNKNLKKEGKPMLLLSKLDDTPIIVPIEAIKYIEKVPDTLINFVNGDTLIVRQSFEEIDQMVADWKARVLKLSTSL